MVFINYLTTQNTVLLNNNNYISKSFLRRFHHEYHELPIPRVVRYARNSTTLTLILKKRKHPLLERSTRELRDSLEIVHDLGEAQQFFLQLYLISEQGIKLHDGHLSPKYGSQARRSLVRRIFPKNHIWPRAMLK